MTNWHDKLRQSEHMDLNTQGRQGNDKKVKLISVGQTTRGAKTTKTGGVKEEKKHEEKTQKLKKEINRNQNRNTGNDTLNP